MSGGRKRGDVFSRLFNFLGNYCTATFPEERSFKCVIKGINIFDKTLMFNVSGSPLEKGGIHLNMEVTVSFHILSSSSIRIT